MATICDYCGVSLQKTDIYRHIRLNHRGQKRPRLPIYGVSGELLADPNAEPQPSTSTQNVRPQPYHRRKRAKNPAMSFQGESMHAQAMNHLHRQYAIFRSAMQTRGVPPNDIPLLDVTVERTEIHAVLRFEGDNQLFNEFIFE